MQRDKVDDWIGALYALVTAVIAAVVVFAYDAVEFYCKAYRGGFALSNTALAGIALMLIAGGYVLLKRRFAQAERASAPEAKMPVWLLWGPPVLLFAAEVFTGYHIYAIQSGDIRRMIETGFFLGRGKYELIETAYFEIYPNNIPLAALFAAVMKTLLALGLEPGIERYTAILMVLQCCVGLAASAAVMHLSWSFLRRKGMCLAVFAVYAFLVGLSPWYAAPYSDGMALAFPVVTAALDLYSRKAERSGPGRLFSWMGVGALGALALMIKPQSAIVFIAIVLYDAARCLLGGLTGWKQTLMKLTAVLCVFAVVTGPVQTAIQNVSGLGKDEEKRISVLHYLYMGLDWATNGSYAAWDRISEEDVPAYEERNRQYLEMIGERIGDLTPVKFVQHFGRKLLVNFSDGTFAWGYDGYQALEEKHEVLSPLLRSYFWGDGENHVQLATVEQLLWLIVLMLCPLAAGSRKKLALAGNRAEAETYSVLMLSVLGIVAFNMLFEARARYIYVMVPVMALLAVSALVLKAESSTVR